MSSFGVDSLTRHANERDKTVAKTLNSRVNMHQNFPHSLNERSRDISQGDRSDKGLQHYRVHDSPRADQEATQARTSNRDDASKESKATLPYPTLPYTTPTHPPTHSDPLTHTPQKPTQQGRTQTRKESSAPLASHRSARTKRHQNRFLNSRANSAAVKLSTVDVHR